MTSTTTARDAIVAEISEWTAHRLANETDCGSPDSAESAGAQFLTSVRDATLELCADVAAEDFDRIDDNGAVHEIADGAPSVYTYTKWLQFTDLAAWNEDVTEYGELTDMEQGAGVALYMIAERLANVIVSAIAEAAAEDADTEDDDTDSD